MARGESGRIVIEVGPEVKRRLYAALSLSGSTLKDWFIKNAATFCDESAQPSLFSGRENKQVAVTDQGPKLEEPGIKATQRNH